MTALALSRGDLLRALAVVVIWGLNFVVMKLGLQGLSPMLLGALRFTAASLPFLLFVPRPALPWSDLWWAMGWRRGWDSLVFCSSDCSWA